jgi:hypothetical protein
MGEKALVPFRGLFFDWQVLQHFTWISRTIAFRNQEKRMAPSAAPPEPIVEPVHFGPDADPLDVYRTLKDLADEMPGLRQGKRFNIATFYRWREQGLRTVRLGSTVCSTRRWIDEFIAARSGGLASSPPRSPTRRRREAARAAAELTELGVF